MLKLYRLVRTRNGNIGFSKPLFDIWQNSTFVAEAAVGRVYRNVKNPD